MPTYDYSCRDCGYTREVRTDNLPLLRGWCEGCGKDARHFDKQLSAPIGFKLIGSGFYKASSTAREG